VVEGWHRAHGSALDCSLARLQHAPAAKRHGVLLGLQPECVGLNEGVARFMPRSVTMTHWPVGVTMTHWLTPLSDDCRPEPCCCGGGISGHDKLWQGLISS